MGICLMFWVWNGITLQYWDVFAKAVYFSWRGPDSYWRSTAFKRLAMSLMDSIFGANFANFALLVWWPNELIPSALSSVGRVLRVHQPNRLLAEWNILLKNKVLLFTFLRYLPLSTNLNQNVELARTFPMRRFGSHWRIPHIYTHDICGDI